MRAGVRGSGLGIRGSGFGAGVEGSGFGARDSRAGVGPNGVRPRGELATLDFRFWILDWRGGLRAHVMLCHNHYDLMGSQPQPKASCGIARITAR